MHGVTTKIKNLLFLTLTSNALMTFVQPLVQWKSNKYYILWVCVCTLFYTARNAHAPYCHLWPVRFYHIFHIIS